MCVHDSVRGQVRAALSSTARMLFLVGWRSLCMCTCACDAVPRHLAQKIRVVSLRAGARAPLSDRVRNVRREICCRKRTRGKCGCETPSSSFMHIFGSLSTLRIGVDPDGRAAQSRSWGFYPIPVPHHCGQSEIYAHCRKQASIH